MSLPGGERRMTICPPAWPFTACLTALALRECWARRDWTGLGFNRQGCLRVCVLFPQHCGRPGAGPSGQSASQPASQPVSQFERCCSTVPLLYFLTVREFTWMLFYFPLPPQTLLVTHRNVIYVITVEEKKIVVHREIC